MCIDHVIAKAIGGSDNTENLYPSCRSCNRWKATFSIEEFRKEIEAQLKRLARYSAGFRLADRYDLVRPQFDSAVIFHFEKYQ